MMLYLIHFDKKIHHAQHYLGITRNLKRRLGEHARGTGAKILKRANELEINWHVARVWMDLNFIDEKIIKLQNNGRSYCPDCYESSAKLFNKMDHMPLSNITFPLSCKEIIRAIQNE